MTAAMIGLIGVIAGALLGGIANLAVERRKRLSAARVAGEVIAAELGEVIRRVESSAKPAADWWVRDLPTGAWKKHLYDLAPGLKAGSIESLSAAYSSIDGWNVERTSAHTPPPHEKLKETGQLLESQRQKLLQASARISGRPGRAVARIAGFVVLLALVPAAAAAIFSTRSDVSATTVASVLERRLGSQVTVDCDRVRGDWSCVSRELSRPRNACELASARVSRSRSFTLIRATRNAKCSERSSRRAYTVVDTGKKLFVSPTLQEIGAAEDFYSAEPRQSLWGRFWEFISGESP